MLEVKGLSRNYGETQALDGVSLAFAPGAIHAVLGENGSGKSTLVKILSGVVSPSAGSVEVAGEKVGLFRPAELQALGIATVFQEVLLAPDRSVTDNILLGLDGLLKRSVLRGERKQRAQAVLKQFAVTEIPLDHPAGQLPLAVQQLVVLARAVVRTPRILILDEVTAALDFADREAVFAMMRKLASQGCLILFITHRMDEVMTLSDRISVLRGGNVVATEERGTSTASELLKAMAPRTAAELAHG